METMTCHVAMWYVAGAELSKVKATLCKSAYESSVAMSMFKITNSKEAFHSVHAHLGGD